MSIKIDGSAFRAGGRPRSAVGEDAMNFRISGGDQKYEPLPRLAKRGETV